MSEDESQVLKREIRDSGVPKLGMLPLKAGVSVVLSVSRDRYIHSVALVDIIQHTLLS